MRFSPIVLLLTFTAAGFTTSDSFGEDNSYAAARAHARRDLQLAKLDSRYYWQIEYPRQRRALHAAIRLTEAEIRCQKLLLREYQPFNRYSVGNPLSLTINDLEICLLEAELRLDELRQERNNLVRFHSDDARLLDLEVLEARRRVIELEGGGVIEISESQ
jgi:hypothetical protein